MNENSFHISLLIMKGVIGFIFCFTAWGVSVWGEPVINAGSGGVSQDRAYRDIKERIKRSDAINEKDAGSNRYRGDRSSGGAQELRRLERERNDIIRR